MARDTILLSEFMPITQLGFRKILDHYALWLPEVIDWFEFHYLLTFVPDTEEFFPSGKWATIQRVDGMLTEIVLGKLKLKP